jgi:lysophospholipase L1-like esterase
VSVGLVAVGHGARLPPLGAVSPEMRSDYVLYPRAGGVLEWYAGRASGVEQGFTLARRPAGRAGQLTLALRLEGSSARLVGSEVEFLTRWGQVALRYGGLVAFDSSGRRLAAWLALSGSRLLLRVADRGARYPLRIDPIIQPGPNLTASRDTSSTGLGAASLPAGPRDGQSLTRMVTDTVPAANQFTVSHVRSNTHDGSVTFWANVPGPGTVDVLETAWKDNFATVATLPQPSARRFVFARVRAIASRATMLHLRVQPDKQGRHLLRAHRYRVTTRLWITFTPTGGEARSIGLDGLKLTPPASSGGSPEARPAFVMRALGDSVTAGFGFFSNGTGMSPLQLPFCIPQDSQPNNRCSSNSPNGPGQTGPVGWSPDYGLANDVSWAAQAAHTFGLSGSTAFQNLAVSGSTPADWARGGYLNPILDRIVNDDPDLTVMTLGANPLLSIFLTGSGAWCAFTLTDAQLRACVQQFIVAQRVGPLLTDVVDELLAAPRNRLVVSLYHLAIPSVTLFTARDVQILFSAFNATITSAMQHLPSYGSRVFVISPPPFFIGRAPGSYVCPSNHSAVDGPSHQSQVTQDELALDPFLSFCPGRPWIISADTGIHPNPEGYAQFASALVSLVRHQSWAPAGLGLNPDHRPRRDSHSAS